MANTCREIALKNKNDMVDEALRESFPASDPPAWTLGTDQGDDAQRKPGHRKTTKKSAKE